MTPYGGAIGPGTGVERKFSFIGDARIVTENAMEAKPVTEIQVLEAAAAELIKAMNEVRETAGVEEVIVYMRNDENGQVRQNDMKVGSGFRTRPIPTSMIKVVK